LDFGSFCVHPLQLCFSPLFALGFCLGLNFRPGFALVIGLFVFTYVLLLPFKASKSVVTLESDQQMEKKNN
jgi:hypothetical protein